MITVDKRNEIILEIKTIMDCAYNTDDYGAKSTVFLFKSLNNSGKYAISVVTLFLASSLNAADIRYVFPQPNVP